MELCSARRSVVPRLVLGLSCPRDPPAKRGAAGCCRRGGSRRRCRDARRQQVVLVAFVAQPLRVGGPLASLHPEAIQSMGLARPPARPIYDGPGADPHEPARPPPASCRAVTRHRSLPPNASLPRVLATPSVEGLDESPGFRWFLSVGRMLRREIGAGPCRGRSGLARAPPGPADPATCYEECLNPLDLCPHRRGLPWRPAPSIRRFVE